MMENNQDIKPVPPLIPEKKEESDLAEMVKEIGCIHCDKEGLCNAHPGVIHPCVVFNEDWEPDMECDDFEGEPETLTAEDMAKDKPALTTTDTATKDGDEFDYKANYVQPKIELDGSKDIWESGLSEDIHSGTECPDCRVPDILISYPAYLYIRSMAEKIDTEFLAYLSFNDKIEEKVLSRIYIPTQAVSSASVTVDDKEKGKRADAVLHKHPGSLNSFSGVDEHSVNANHDISILMTENEPDIENWTAQVRFHTKCDRILVKKVKVRIYTPKVKVDISKITKKVYTYPIGNTMGPGTYYRYWPSKNKDKKSSDDDPNQQGLDCYGNYGY